MTPGLILLLSLVGWILGPMIVRLTGTLLLLLALLVWAIPAAPHTSTGTLAGIAIIGTLMRYAGTTWRASRGTPRRYPPSRRRQPGHATERRRVIGDDWREPPSHTWQDQRGK
jgi:hypothetical protein